MKYVLDESRNFIEAYSKADINEFRKGRIITLHQNAWSGNTQRVNIPNVSSSDNLVMDIQLTNIESPDEEINEWSQINGAVIEDNFITFYARRPLNRDINVIINGVSLDAQDLKFLPISTEDRTSFEGTVYPTLKEKNDADVNFLLKKIEALEEAISGRK